MSDEPREVLSVKDIADYLGVSESKIRQLIRRDAIPYVRIGGQYKFFLPAVRQWLQDRSVIPSDCEASAAPTTISTRIWNQTVEK